MREVERAAGIIKQAAACFTDWREPGKIEHSVEELTGQRLYALALGCEDLNDHENLRHDPLLATLVGKADPGGMDRRRERDRGKPLAAPSTLILDLDATDDPLHGNKEEGNRHDKAIHAFISCNRIPYDNCVHRLFAGRGYHFYIDG